MEENRGAFDFGCRRSPRITPHDKPASELLQYRRRRRERTTKLNPIDKLPNNSLAVDIKEKEDPEKNDESFNNGQLPKVPASLPEKGKLILVLNALQEKDSTNIFAEPVDPIEVEGYSEVISNPMDLGTIRRKVEEGKYTTVEHFERDIFLTFDNALEFNDKQTIYYRKADALRSLAEKMLHILRTDQVHFMSSILKLRKEPLRVKRAARRTSSETNQDEARCPRSKIHKSISNAAKDNRSDYRPWQSYLSQAESSASTIYSSTKQLVNANTEDFNYKESLMKFAQYLGPTAQKVAQRKIFACDLRSETLRRDRAAMPPPVSSSVTASLQQNPWNWPLLHSGIGRTQLPPTRLSPRQSGAALSAAPGEFNPVAAGCRSPFAEMASSGDHAWFGDVDVVPQMGLTVEAQQPVFLQPQYYAGAQSGMSGPQVSSPVVSQQIAGDPLIRGTSDFASIANGAEVSPSAEVHHPGFFQPQQYCMGAQSVMLGSQGSSPVVPQQTAAAPLIGSPSDFGSIADTVGVGAASWSQLLGMLDGAVSMEMVKPPLPPAVVWPTINVKESGGGTFGLPDLDEPSTPAEGWRDLSRATGASSSSSVSHGFQAGSKRPHVQVLSLEELFSDRAD